RRTLPQAAGDLDRGRARMGPIPDAAPRPRIHAAQLRISAVEEETERLHARHVLRLAADGGRQSARARVHVRDDQRGNPAALRLGLSALGLRSAQPNLGPAVPVGEGQAQHPRRQRGPLVQAASAQRAAAVRRRRGVTLGGTRHLLGRPRLRHRRCYQSACRLLFIALLFVALGLPASALAQPAVEDFYKGRQINLVVGYGPGGGYDVVARLLARYLGRYVAGNPNIVVQNMPGAGSLRAANYLYTVAPKDGTTIGLFGSDMPLIGLIANNPNVQFDPRKFIWLGSSSSFAGVAYILMVRPDAAA